MVHSTAVFSLPSLKYASVIGALKGIQRLDYEFGCLLPRVEVYEYLDLLEYCQLSKWVCELMHEHRHFSQPEVFARSSALFSVCVSSCEIVVAHFKTKQKSWMLISETAWQTQNSCYHWKLWGYICLNQHLKHIRASGKHVIPPGTQAPVQHRSLWSSQLVLCRPLSRYHKDDDQLHFCTNSFACRGFIEWQNCQDWKWPQKSSSSNLSAMDRNTSHETKLLRMGGATPQNDFNLLFLQFMISLSFRRVSVHMTKYFFLELSFQIFFFCFINNSPLLVCCLHVLLLSCSGLLVGHFYQPLFEACIHSTPAPQKGFIVLPHFMSYTLCIDMFPLAFCSDSQAKSSWIGRLLHLRGLEHSFSTMKTWVILYIYVYIYIHMLFASE